MLDRLLSTEFERCNPPRFTRSLFPDGFVRLSFFRQDSINLRSRFPSWSHNQLASVSADDVRDVINVSSAGVPGVKVLKMVKRAEVAFELETGKRLNYFYVGCAFEVLIAGDKG
jgi:hypothetical protein